MEHLVENKIFSPREGFIYVIQRSLFTIASSEDRQSMRQKASSKAMEDSYDLPEVRYINEITKYKHSYADIFNHT